MKTATLLASALFGTLAIAAPLNRRAKVTKTEVVVETQVVYVTVWQPQAPVVVPTTAPGLFYEQPAKDPSTAQTTTTPIYNPPKKEKKLSRTSTPEPIVTPTPEPKPVYTPPPPKKEPVKEEPVEEPVKEEPIIKEPVIKEPVIKEPVIKVPVKEPVKEAVKEESSPPSNGGGNAFNGEVTVYDTYNSAGACGSILSDEKYTAAISVDQWGADVWGSADNINGNPWCGKPVDVTLNGKTVTVKIMDKCMGCKVGDIDLTRAAWNDLTGSAYGSRLQGSWVA